MSGADIGLNTDTLYVGVSCAIRVDILAVGHVKSVWPLAILTVGHAKSVL